jgi:multidrug transporter EmrE-like cation transporter
MVYLLLAIACSASIALLFKHSETSGMNRYAVTSANYVTASVVSLVLLLARGADLPSGFSVSEALGEIAGAIVQSTMLTQSGSVVWGALVGLGAGAFFFLAFLYYQISVRDYGVGLAGAFTKLGILVPMSLSLVLWRELPTVVQWIGIGLAIGSIAIVNWPEGRDLRGSLKPALLLLFTFGGIAEFSNKVFQKYGLQDDKAIFLLFTFATAFCFSMIATVRKRLPVTRRDLVMGIAVGVPNLFSSFFLIRALDTVSAAAAFPAYGAGTILIINIVGVAFFKERLNRREVWGVVLTILALILINLR